MAKIIPHSLPRQQRLLLESLLEKTLKNLSRHPKGIPFFLDLLSESERIMLARRIQIAQYLLKGWSSIRIRTKLGVSFDAIEHVERWLKEKLEEYRSIVPKPLDEEKFRSDPHYNPYSWESVSRKYPLQSLLFNIVLGRDSKGRRPTTYT